MIASEWAVTIRINIVCVEKVCKIIYATMKKHQWERESQLVVSRAFSTAILHLPLKSLIANENAQH